MGLLDQVLGSVIGSRMGGRGGMGGGFGGGFGGGLGGGLGGLGGGMMGGGLGKAMLLMFAAKAAQEYLQRRRSDSPEAGGGGGLGGMLGGAGGAGGLGALIEQFKRNGHGEAIDSWIKPGPNPRLAPQELADALGHDTVDDLAKEAGMPKQKLLEELSETLPDTVDQLTPDGRIPPPHAL